MDAKEEITLILQTPLKDESGKSKFLKSSNHFEAIGDLDNTYDIKKGSFGQNTKILKKIPLLGESPTKNKFNAHWFAKHQPPEHAIREIVTEDVFRILSGKERAAKVRLMRDEKTSEIYSISKLFKNFKTFYDLSQEKKDADSIKLYDTYMRITENLQGYEEMLAITLLLGRDDCHNLNWGVVTQDNNKFAVTFDYGLAANGSFSIYKLMSKCTHFRERIVCEKFLTVCERIIEKFTQNHNEIEKALLRGIKAAETAFASCEIPSLDKIMGIFTNNKRQLTHLCHQIRTELAISKGDPEAFENSIKELDLAYQFPVLSTQEKSTFFLPPWSTLHAFINQGYDCVFLCTVLPEKREKDALYLLKTEGVIEVYLTEGESKGLIQKQRKAIEELVNFPENSIDFIKIVGDTSRQIISICGYTQKKPPEVQAKLNEIYERYRPN